MVKLGRWPSNTKTRRDRLNREQLAQLAGPGLPWTANAVAAIYHCRLKRIDGKLMAHAEIVGMGGNGTEEAGRRRDRVVGADRLADSPDRPARGRGEPDSAPSAERCQAERRQPEQEEAQPALVAQGH